MKNKILLITLIVLSINMVGCGNKKEQTIETTNINSVIQANQFDDQIMGEIEENEVNIKTTFYFKKDKAVNALTVNEYRETVDAQNLYKGLRFNNEYSNVSIENNVVTYSYSEDGFTAYKDMSKNGITDVLKDTGYKIR